MNVALVTAVGFVEPEPFEERLAGLLAAIDKDGADDDVRRRLWVLGGQCNYLFRCSTKADGDGSGGSDDLAFPRLIPVPPEEWESAEISSWRDREDQVTDLLDVAEGSLRELRRTYGL